MKRLLILNLLTTLLTACEKPQIADYVSYAPKTSYQKIDQYGQVMHPHAGPWQCILDTETGLLWENKSDDNGVHHYAWTYTYYEHDQSRDQRESLFRDGSCESAAKGSCTTQALIHKSNKQMLCGRKTWRLPSKSELEGLIEKNISAQIPLIASGIFPHTKASSYWSSTKDADSHKVFALNFTDGSGSYFARKGAFYVRLVASDL